MPFLLRPSPLCADAMHFWSRAGCASGEIFLWQFGAATATAGYTPIPALAGAAPPPAAGSMFSTPARTWAVDRPGALAALGHWGQPQAVRRLRARFCQDF